MNKSEKIIVALLGLLLVWYLWQSTSQAKREAEEQARAAQERRVAVPKPASGGAGSQASRSVSPATNAVVAAKPAVEPPRPRVPEQFVALTNSQAIFVFSTRGATLKSATLKDYFAKPDARGDDDPRFKLDFSAAPALALSGVPGLDADADWVVQARGEDSVTFAVTNAAGLAAARTITLKGDYQLSCLKVEFVD